MSKFESIAELYAHIEKTALERIKKMEECPEKGQKEARNLDISGNSTTNGGTCER